MSLAGAAGAWPWTGVQSCASAGGAAAGGLAWPVLRRLPLFRLPGDIVYRGKNTTFYFPIVTCLLLSVILSLILWLVNRGHR